MLQWRGNAGHVVSTIAHGAVYRIRATQSSAIRTLQLPQKNLLCTKLIASLASFDLATQLLSALWFNQQKLPSLKQSNPNVLRNIPHILGRNHIIIPMNVSIKHALKVKMIALFSVFVEVLNLGAMSDPTFAADGVEGTAIGVHASKQHARIGELTIDILWAIIPVHPNGVYRFFRIIACMQKFHNPREVVWLSRWFADEINMVYDKTC